MAFYWSRRRCLPGHSLHACSSAPRASQCGISFSPSDSFAYCAVPLSAADCFLFAGIAVLLAALLANKLSAVWLLLAGGVLGVVNYYANLLRLSNAIALWLQIQPPYLFWYAFLPPLLVDAAMRLDFYTFSKASGVALLQALTKLLGGSACRLPSAWACMQLLCVALGLAQSGLVPP